MSFYSFGSGHTDNEKLRQSVDKGTPAGQSAKSFISVHSENVFKLFSNFTVTARLLAAASDRLHEQILRIGQSDASEGNEKLSF